MKIPLENLIYWFLIPFLNFIIWFYYGKTHTAIIVDCSSSSSSSNPTNPITDNTDTNDPLFSPQSLEQLLDQSLEQLAVEAAATPCHQLVTTPLQCTYSVKDAPKQMTVKFEETSDIDAWRSAKLAEMINMEILIKSYADTKTAVLYHTADRPCETYDVHWIDMHSDSCFAVIFSETVNMTLNIARIDQDIDIYGLSISNPDPSQVDKYSQKYSLNQHNQNKFWPTGFFRKVPKERGRERTVDKLRTFLNHFDEINRIFLEKLHSHGLYPGSDVVAMVVNEGESDLFLNFACSCAFHNLSLHHVFAFTGSEEMNVLIESTGAMAMYHPGFASVSKRASTDYLDRVFVDMMWYKAFSVYLVLRHGYHVLFQDVDLVWFRDPFPYFHRYSEEHRDALGFFSDDGQRSKRYTPFFANSGFYYLQSHERSLYFTWSIMIAMDAIQVLGSHQNVFTTRLLEGLAISAQYMKLLPLHAFPTGIMYHHQPNYMKDMKFKKVFPYNFHM